LSFFRRQIQKSCRERAATLFSKDGVVVISNGKFRCRKLFPRVASIAHKLVVTPKRFDMPVLAIQNRMVAGLVEVVEREETLVAEACNHPNCLVLPFRLELIWVAA
jgi:hypothetical protein